MCLDLRSTCGPAFSRILRKARAYSRRRAFTGYEVIHGSPQVPRVVSLVMAGTLRDSWLVPQTLNNERT